MIDPIKIWCNTVFPSDVTEELTRLTTPHRIVLSKQLSQSNLVMTGPDDSLGECSAAFGQPDLQQVMDTPSIKWIHLSSAGYTRYDTEAFRRAMRSRRGVLTNSSAVYATPCAEHALAMIMSLARQIPQAIQQQQCDRSWHSDQLRRNSRRLENQTILIYGFGSIAKELVQLLQPLGMKVTGVRRNARGDEGVSIISPEEADALLPHTDHVMNILPASSSTENFFSTDRLSLLSPTTFFYNIGRGSTVDQDFLCKLLSQQKIAGAYLDVTTPEPLPVDHPLWQLPDCWITPHTAGGHEDEPMRLVKHFVDNLKRYAENQPMLDIVIS